MEPLACILKLSREEMATTGVVYAAVVTRVNFNTRQVIIEGDIISFVRSLSVSCLVCSTLDAVTL